MKDTKTFTHKGARRKITIMLGLQKSCLLNKVCKANQITPREVFLIGLDKCAKEGRGYSETYKIA